jgi:hypothetical protein
LLYEETEAEVDSQRGKVEELVTLGRDLVKGENLFMNFPRTQIHDQFEGLGFVGKSDQSPTIVRLYCSDWYRQLQHT